MAEPCPPTQIILHSVHPPCKATSGQHTSLFTPPQNIGHLQPVPLTALESVRHREATQGGSPTPNSSPAIDPLLFRRMLDMGHREVTCSVFRLHPRTLIHASLCSRITHIFCKFILIPFLSLTLQLEILNHVSLTNGYLSSNHTVSIQPIPSSSEFCKLCCLFSKMLGSLKKNAFCISHYKNDINTRDSPTQKPQWLKINRKLFLIHIKSNQDEGSEGIQKQGSFFYMMERVRISANGGFVFFSRWLPCLPQAFASSLLDGML